MDSISDVSKLQSIYPLISIDVVKLGSTSLEALETDKATEKVKERE